MLTPQQIYTKLFRTKQMQYLNIERLSEDASNRKANIYAVKNTWTAYNNQHNKDS